MKHCDTCVFGENRECPIFQVACNSVVHDVQLSEFGCEWHITPKEQREQYENERAENQISRNREVVA